MQPSSLQRYLEGKHLPTYEAAPVKRIEKKGTDRIVTFEDGTKKVYTERRLLSLFHKRLQTDQAKKALRSIRQTPNKTFKVTIGGNVKGERKEFKHRGHALNAIKKAYPESKGFYVL